ncbi:paired amphipathic helix protein Sin3b isoform X2 [Danaus plexippus]|uniref:paired amphipathic helix protein Sin3b isoform X2 n=1 Tax=Danaus plexippus TaxID=13037 RepID=UPI002AB147F6|nr:paired amphipathic helix protein Sin3b isoform X2 [Danaus plexippus]
MMKRTGPRLGPDEPSQLTPSPAQIQQAGASNIHNISQSGQPQLLGAATMLSVGGNFSRPRGNPPVINYLKANTVQYAPPKPQAPRLKLVSQQPALIPGRQSPLGGPLPAPPAAQFQRLKVEDALSYLDQVKYKFNTQPQVYNDFLDIMKEFKSQTVASRIDTPGVITRVSNLFKGHPELIVGFNTFLPPGYKIEVQSNGQVSVSMPSPTGAGCPPAGAVGVGVGASGGVGVGGGGNAVGVTGAGVMMGVHHPPPQPQLVHLLPVPQSVSNAIVHNLSVNATATNTLHHISQAHQQIEAAAIHHPPGSAANASASHAAAGQPVEFNHAIEYVNKIKSRFSRQPDKYKRFLEILHAYQRGHRDLKEPHAKQQTEQEVYAQVAKLFEKQDDLLAEFGQFLPDAKAVTKPTPIPPHSRSPPPQVKIVRMEAELDRFPSSTPSSPPHGAVTHVTHATHVTPAPTPTHAAHVTHVTHAHVPPQPHPVHTQPPAPKHTSAAVVTPQHHLKRSPSFTSTTQISSGAPAAKRARVRDLSVSEAGKMAAASDYSFFDRARKALRSQHVYDNFLRCLLLFTNEIISSSELLCVTAPFLCRHPELQKWLQDFVGPVSPPHTPTNTHTGGYNNNFTSSSNLLYERTRLGSESKNRYEPLGPLGAQMRHERPQGDAAMDIDLSTCKRLGTSYCALPREAAARKCSGRTPLCKEVLNDTWVSFPTWSEDSTFVTSRKTQYEEYIYRCEDERFELDVVIETNAATIRVLEGAQKKLSRMSPEDAAKYRLDDCLGGHSPTIHQRALKRIYGDKAVDIIAGLKKNPVVAVPVVLRRLKAKEEEWREAQKGFNKQWREQNEKYYLKSLDHQGITFKQNDLKALRSKCLFNEVESAFAVRKPGPHLLSDYGTKSRHEAIKIARDAAELLIHHARRQTGIQKAEKRRIKLLLRQFLPDLMAHPRLPLSDDEHEEEKEEPTSPGSPTADQADEKTTVKNEKQESSESDNASDKSSRNNKNDKENKPKNNNTETKDSTNSIKRSISNEEASIKMELKNENDLEDDYRDHPPNESRFVCTSSWYLFLRLHGVLCARLCGARQAAQQLAAGEAARASTRPPSVAAALRLKPTNLPADASSPSEYYNALLELVKGVLDGNVESSAYEDAAREMLGIKAYPLYTLDKVVSIAVRQLQHCVSESWSVRATELASRGPRGPPYIRRALRALRPHHTAFLVTFYFGDTCKVGFELMEAAGEGRASPHRDQRLSPTQSRRDTNGDASVRHGGWSPYRYAPIATNKPVFLRRNARRSGAGATGAHTASAPPDISEAPAHARRRKPPRLHDHDCGVTSGARLAACRPHQLYRAGCLTAARVSHARLSAARRTRFRTWLDSRTH